MSMIAHADRGASSIGRLMLVVFLPFATGYFFLQFYRAVNATIAGRLIEQVGVDAPQLGLLTSMFFFAAAALQLPLGIAIDRFGPARAQASLLLVATAGTLVFAIAQDFETLLVGRLLIGFGVGSGLMAGMTAIALWFPKERVGLLNGVFIAAGTLGAVAASAPLEWTLTFVSWRDVFGWASLAIALQIATLLAVVPDRPHVSAKKTSALAGLRQVYSDRRFWRLAPVSSLVLATAWALVGLWASPWLRDVEAMQQRDIAAHLFTAAMSQGFGAIGFGILLDRLRAKGIGPATAMAGMATVFITTELALGLGLPLPTYIAWSLIGIISAGTVVSFTITAQYFAKDLIGRANAALNIFHLGGAFAVQSLFGILVGWWPRAADGHYPAEAYRTTILGLVVVQAIAVLWFLWPRREVTAGVDEAVPRSSMAPVLSGMIGILAFAASPNLTQMANAELDPVCVAIVRSVGGGIVALGLIALLRIALPTDWRTWVLLCLGGAASYTAFPVILGYGVATTSGTHSALMLAFMPLFTAALGSVVERKLPGPVWFAGTAIATLATALTLLHRGEGPRMPTVHGDLTVLAASLVMAVGYVACAKAGRAVGVWPATLWSIAIGAALFAPITPAYLQAASWGELSDRTWLALAGLVIGCGVIGQIGWLFALTKGGIARLAPLQLLQPFLTILFATYLLSEWPDAWVWSAAAVAVAGVAISRKEPPSEQTEPRSVKKLQAVRMVLACVVGMGASWGLHALAVPELWPVTARLAIATGYPSAALPAGQQQVPTDTAPSHLAETIERLNAEMQASRVTLQRTTDGLLVLGEQIRALETRIGPRQIASLPDPAQPSPPVEAEPDVIPSRLASAPANAATPAPFVMTGCKASQIAGARSLVLMFGRNDTNLSDEHVRALEALLKQIAQCDHDVIAIEGHTDSRGLPLRNHQLSSMRADLVREYLRSQGIPDERLRVEGKGADYPIAANETEVGRNMNRRVEVMLMRGD